MEVDTLAGDDVPPPLSPQASSAPPEKVVEEDDSLGYTITMNECDDDSNESSAASHSRTATPSAEQDSADSRDAQPPRLKKFPENGDGASKQDAGDFDFSKEKTKSGKQTAADKDAERTPDINGVSQSSEDGEVVEEIDRKKTKKGERPEVDPSDVEAASASEAAVEEPHEKDTTEKERTDKLLESESKIEESSKSEETVAGKSDPKHNDEKKNDSNRQKHESGKERDSDEEKNKADGKKDVSDSEKGDNNERKIDTDREKHAEGKKDGDKKNNDNDQKEDHERGKGENVAEKENSMKSGGSNSNSPHTSPDIGQAVLGSAKLALAGKLASTGSFMGKSNSMVLDARSGVSVPYVPASSTTSLLSSTAGVRLVLPSGGQGQVMYIPNSGTFLTSPATGFPGTSTRVSIGSSTNPILIPAINASISSAGVSQSYFVAGAGGLTAGVLRPPYVAQPPPPPPPTFASSSQGMIDMIKWEAENHINVKPKYVKPNPKAELGNLAKWIFDLGSDLVKEFVYHDLVKIQRKRKDDGNLNDKEKSDFNKLQEIDEDLNKKIGHLKFRLNKSCRCGFRADLASVLYLHKEHAHHERGGFLNCSMCKFSTRQPGAFKFHMEAEHSMCGRVENRPCFFECALCPYESNYPNRVEQHKTRCLKQFRQAFNLHPSCLTGPEVNLCLENVFYFVFTRQFLNTITPQSTNAGSNALTLPVASSTNFKDLKPKSASQNLTAIRAGSGILGKFGTQVSATQSSLISQQYVGKTSRMNIPSASSQLPGSSSMSRNFPVISSQIGGKAVTTSTAAGLQPGAVKQPPTVPQQPNIPNSSFEVCEICGGYVKDRKALRIHFFYAHRIDMPFGVFERTQPPLYCATCFARFWTAQGLQKHIEVHKADLAGANAVGNGVAGKCISCGHRVPNILMHMRMVHNRELRHYLAALMCIFCGNRFSSKREVENHMGSQHGVVVKNSTAQSLPLTPGQNQVPVVAPKPTVTNQRPSAGSAVTKQSTTVSPAPKSGGSKLNRGSQCVLCNLSFSRNVDLTRHCMRVHHTCMKCGLVVVDKESLTRHTCLHSAAGMRTCQICGEKGFHPAYYIKHMRDRHLRRCSVVLRRIDRAVVETFKRPITISDSEDDDVVEAPLSPKRQKLQEVQKNSTVSKPDKPKDEKAEQEIEKSVAQKEHQLEDQKGGKLDKDKEHSSDEKELQPADEDKSNSADTKEANSDDEKVQNSTSKTLKPDSLKKGKSESHAADSSSSKKEPNLDIAEEMEDKKVKRSEKKNGESVEKSASGENLVEGADSKSKKGVDDSKNRTVCSGNKTQKTDKNTEKTNNDRKRKTDDESDSSSDDVPYSKRLRRSSRANSDVLELD
ncbi:hypothetical protein BaRGS_00002933 [Batillaria attramentaria]|uniref:C2H2-type domain-containing protein n=1 Tax=Batillaria attramentaria TaxID=370345 RepID=A0ABD0M380_9CAEN